MKLRFVASDPRSRARPDLDSVLGHGNDQLAIACAFLTLGGVETLKRHAARLRLPNSFVVVAWELPTSLEALNELYSIMPGNLYVHLGSLTPAERGVGPGLMHSKVFYSRSGNDCRLWTGSHNLTASAMQGVNCEAAMLVDGDHGEQVIVDALSHLNQIRAEAMRFDPLNPPSPLTPDQTLVIHAEAHTTLKTPPWFVHLRPDTTDFDRAMRPPAKAWIYLYNSGTLQLGRRRPTAVSAYSGTLTALNFTERHPRNPGSSADWNAADYVIELRSGVPCLVSSTPHTVTPSQGGIRVDAVESTDALWLTESPLPTLERIVGKRRISEVDPEFRQFFTKQSRSGSHLLHQEYRSIKSVVRVPRKEAGFIDEKDLENRLGTSIQTEIVIDENLNADDKFSFIYRAKYRR